MPPLPPAEPHVDEDVILDVRRLGVAFGAVTALGGVDLRVRRGEIRGLIGPNGAGKSTLVDALTGFLPQHTGTITVAGIAVDTLSPHRIARSGLRRTFQQDRVPPTMTVGEYVRFVGCSEATAERITEALDYLGCPPPSTRCRSST